MPQTGILAVSGRSEKQLAESSLGHGLQADDVPVSSDRIPGSGPKISRKCISGASPTGIPSPLLFCTGGATFELQTQCGLNDDA
jgi:hypothetical protein